MTSQVYLALGSNLGQRTENLQLAIDKLGQHVAIEAVSPVYVTEPWGVTDQPEFLNLCLSARTRLSADDLLAVCKNVERELGREPGPRWGPRLIDIDILFYGSQVIDRGELQVPHPRLAERAFVLVPLADIAPDLVDPRSGRTVTELLAQLNASGVRLPSQPRPRVRRPKSLAWGVKTYVMGILNVTPDSFSGDGLISGDGWLGDAVNLARDFVTAGADILDIGGESTRPGSSPISEELERQRVLPVIRAVRDEVDVPLSVDTYRARIAEEALAAGADWVNDVWGLRMDPAMASLVGQRGCPVVIMHNRSKPKNVEQARRLGGRYVGIQYDDLIGDIKRELEESIDLALQAGANETQIIVDPGIGFGKTVSQNLRLLNELDEFKEMGFPLLVGTSRKSFIGYTLDLPPEERLEGTTATVAIAIDRGADVIRVHDVKAMVRVARMTDWIVRQNDNA